MSNLPQLMDMCVNWDVGHKFHPALAPLSPSSTQNTTHNTHYKPWVDQGVVRGDCGPPFFSETFHYF